MATLTETTQSGPPLVLQQDTGVSGQTINIAAMMEQLRTAERAAQIVYLFSQCNDTTGGYVKLASDYHFIPVLIGTDNRPVALYNFVEVIDEVLDYESIQKELPNLSFSQIGGAVAFLRRLAQSNPENIDLDDLEEQAEVDDPAFLEELRTALVDKETSRVLDRS